MLTPPTANWRENNKGPLSALPAHIRDGGAAKQTPRSRTECDWPPVLCIIFVAGKCSATKIEDDGCRSKVHDQQRKRCAQTQQPLVASFQHNPIDFTSALSAART